MLHLFIFFSREYIWSIEHTVIFYFFQLSILQFFHGPSERKPSLQLLIRFLRPLNVGSVLQDIRYREIKKLLEEVGAQTPSVEYIQS